MSRSIIVGSWLWWCVALLSGCGSSAEGLVKAVTDDFNELAQVLAAVSTADQLKRAEPKLRSVGKKLRADMEKMKGLNKLDPAENAAIGKKRGPAMAAARQRVLSEVNRISRTIDPLAGSRIEVMLGMK